MSGIRCTGLHRRQFSILALGLPLLSSCAPRAERIEVSRDNAFTLPEGHGFVGIVARKVFREGCIDAFGPNLFLATPSTERRRRIFLGKYASEHLWLPDPGRPRLLRRAYLLHLPAGRHVFVRASYLTRSAEIDLELPPWTFEVVAGQVAYIGGPGLWPDFSTFLSCIADSGSFFYHSEPGTDISFLRSQFPTIGSREVVDRSHRPKGWDDMPPFARGASSGA